MRISAICTSGNVPVVNSAMAFSSGRRRSYSCQRAWAYDDRDKTLFVSDGFAFSHYDSAECILLSHELPKPPTAAEARLVLDLALYWSRYADNTAIVTDLAEMLQKYETRMICPS